MNRFYFVLQILIYYLYFCELEWFSYDFSKINVVKEKIAMSMGIAVGIAILRLLQFNADYQLCGLPGSCPKPMTF
jgi:hypothetical protein